MKNSKRSYSRFAVAATVVVALAGSIAARSASVDADIANGFDPITMGLEIGNYSGGTVLAGETVPYGSGPVAAHTRPTDEEIANGLDPVTMGLEIGNYSGGTVLAGETVPYESATRVAARGR
ncbi:MAG TPA: hypothetical protein VI319_03160 [Burkholderiales bacterium]